METPVTMPQFAETLSEGTVAKWLKRVGEHVDKYDPLVEIQTDKVNVEMAAPASGVLREISAGEGETVPVGGLLAYITEEAGAPGQAEEPAPEPAREMAAASPAEPGRAAVSGNFTHNGRRITPVVARLAEQYGIDLSKIQGSGLGGRVTKQDVLAYVEQAQRAAAPAGVRPEAGAAPPMGAPGAPAAAAGPQPPSPVQPAEPPHPLRAPEEEAEAAEEAIPLSPVRRVIAEHMARSKFSAPHAWTMVEVDVSALVHRREQIKEEFRRRENVDLTYVPFVVKAVAEALKEFPVLNSAWGEDRIILKKRIHIGIAVSRDEGLIVPVIRDADRLSLAGLAHAIGGLVARARSNTLAPADITGGTFTVNNTGALGSVLSYPIVYPGQAGILTMEAIVKRPVVVDDAIAIRSMMNMALAFDHRILDGGAAGGFLQSVKHKLEHMGPETPLY